MAKADPVLVAKWTKRAEEWKRLGGLANNPHIAWQCNNLAEQAEAMARFWSK